MVLITDAAASTFRYDWGVKRLLVLGSPATREQLTRNLDGLAHCEAVDCDPELGDCVMYVRLEGTRYDAFFFAGFDHPVTRGALPIVAERSVLIPLVDKTPDQAHDGYLFRLPRAIGYRDEAERAAALSAVPKAESVPSYFVGPAGDDIDALSMLARLATDGDWQWGALVEQVRREMSTR